MLKRQIIIGLTIVVLFTINKPVFAQTEAVQKAVEDVKDSIDELINAKDEKSPNEVAIRVETLRKVIDLSVSEAKDLRIKLLSIEPTQRELALWREDVLVKLSQIILDYEEKKELFLKNKSIDLGTVRSLAEAFKVLREKNYLSIALSVNDFLLIKAEEKAIQVTQKRYQKISDDVVKLQKNKSKIGQALGGLLYETNLLITEGGTLHKTAEDLFWSNYLATSTSGVGASTTDQFLNMSIKDLIKASLSKIREAYQIFIEMSNLVRKLR